MSLQNGLFTSESVSAGHPDKLCDIISDTILDAFLTLDPNARVACETFAANDKIIVAGEFRTERLEDFEDVRSRAESIVRQTLRLVGYGDATHDIDPDSCEVEICFNHQSPEIHAGVDGGDVLGAGDQGLMFGYGTDETDSLMPLAWSLATDLVAEASRKIGTDGCPLRPDGKAQVTVRYEDGEPVGIKTVVLSWQHQADVPLKEVRDWLRDEVLDRVVPVERRTDDFEAFINPAGPFTIGGPKGDTGLTGRKIIVDTYGGACPHGGGAFSGKDPSKVDRSGAYAARHVAKTIVAAGLASKCTVQIAYAIGLAEPVSVNVDTHGTGSVPDSELSRTVEEIWDLTPAGIIRAFELLRPIYADTAVLGHFGRWRDLADHRWECFDESLGLLLQTSADFLEWQPVVSREQSTMADTWEEYLCYRRCEGGFLLGICIHDLLGDAPTEWFDDDGEFLPEFRDEAGNLELPDEYEGNTVVGYDGEYLLGPLVEWNNGQTELISELTMEAVEAVLCSLEWSPDDGVEVLAALQSAKDRAQRNKRIEGNAVDADNLDPKKILQRISDTWMIDPRKAHWLESNADGSDAFSWWPGDFRVTVRANRHPAGDDTAVRLRIDTDFLRSLDVRSDTLTTRLASIAHLFTSTYAWVHMPADMQDAFGDKLPEDFDPSRLWLSATAYVRDETAGWLPEFVARMAILQPINAQLHAGELARTLGAGPDASSDPSGPQAQLDGTMHVLSDVIAPVGKEQSRWHGCKEFADFAETWGRSDSCFGTGDPTGLTLETPFGDESALIRLRTDQAHPQLGNGLLATLQLPMLDEELAIAKLANELNYMEAHSWTGFPLLGCWNSRPLGDAFVAAFSMFVPNALYVSYIATNAALWMLNRARWVRTKRFPDLVDQPMFEILNRRLGLRGG